MRLHYAICKSYNADFEIGRASGRGRVGGGGGRLVVADQYYYDKTLEERMGILNAPGTQYLCKTIIFENTAYDNKYEVLFLLY